MDSRKPKDAYVERLGEDEVLRKARRCGRGRKNRLLQGGRIETQFVPFSEGKTGYEFEPKA